MLQFKNTGIQRHSCISWILLLLTPFWPLLFDAVQMRRQRPAAAAGTYSSDEENEKEGGDEGQTFSPTRRQPRRQVTPMSYRKLLDYYSSDTESVSSEKTKTSVTQKTPSSGMDKLTGLDIFAKLCFWGETLFLFVRSGCPCSCRCNGPRRSGKTEKAGSLQSFLGPKQNR